MKRTAWTVLGLAATVAARASLALEPPRFKEDVEVSRVLVIARVIDGQGRPILGLTPADFEVHVGKRRLTVESAQWIQEGTPADAGATAEPAAGAGAMTEATGRLIVIFFQKSFERVRLPGLMRMQSYTRGFIDGLGPKDRVAVLSFDSHLKLWLDFTSDRDKVRDTVSGWLRREERPLEESPAPSLAAHFDREAARRAATPEEALLVTARALERLPGAKSLVLFGWGWGEVSFPSPQFLGRLPDPLAVAMATTGHMGGGYAEARQALAAAHVTVFALDVTDADYHTLEAGLQQVAADTGGFYARTHLFPSQAMARLTGALAGHYILAFDNPRLPPGDHAVSVELVGGRDGRVLARMDAGK